MSQNLAKTRIIQEPHGTSPQCGCVPMPVLHEEHVVGAVVVFGGAQLLGPAGIVAPQGVAHVGVPSISRLICCRHMTDNQNMQLNLNLWTKKKSNLSITGKIQMLFIPVLECHPLVSSTSRVELLEKG